MTAIRLLTVCTVIASLTSTASADDPAKAIFMDRCADGCTVSPGSDSATQNRSSLIDSTRSLGAWSYGDAAWDQLVRCVGDMYRPFDIVVTDEKPAAGQPHQRAIVAGTGPELGSEYAESLGVAPTWCEVHDDVITFTFANSFTDLEMICAVVAQETGHAYGLEHTFACDDAMSWVMPCGQKLFRDADVECGDDLPFEECRCGGATLNSFRSIMSLLGPNLDNPGPTVSAYAEVFDFENNPPVADGPFHVSADIVAPYRIDRVELFINGVLYGTLERDGFEYRLWIDDDVSDGVLDFTVIAYNRIGAASEPQEFTVVKRAACQTSTDCLDDASCAEGRCAQPVTFLEIGAACTQGSECATGRCETNDTETVCTQGCLPIPGGDTCPDGHWCHDAELATATCWPGEKPIVPDDGGSGCQASTGSTPSPGGVALMFVVLLLAGRMGASGSRSTRRG